MCLQLPQACPMAGRELHAHLRQSRPWKRTNQLLLAPHVLSLLCHPRGSIPGRAGQSPITGALALSFQAVLTLGRRPPPSHRASILDQSTVPNCWCQRATWTPMGSPGCGGLMPQSPRRLMTGGCPSQPGCLERVREEGVSRGSHSGYSN